MDEGEIVDISHTCGHTIGPLSTCIATITLELELGAPIIFAQNVVCKLPHEFRTKRLPLSSSKRMTYRARVRLVVQVFRRESKSVLLSLVAYAPLFYPLTVYYGA